MLYDRLVVRPFQPEDAKLEGGEAGTPSVGLTALIDGELAGYGGITLMGGRHWGFFHLGGEGGKYLRGGAKVWVHRMTLQLLASVQSVGEIWAVCDEVYPNAARWMERLGFRQVPDSEKPADVLAYEEALGCKAWLRS